MNYKKKAWEQFSKYIRLKYSDNNGYCICVTCGKSYFWKNIQAGHFIDGRNNSILLNEKLVYPQCMRCNCYKKGMKVEYTIFMLKKFTKKQIKEFTELKHKSKIVKSFEWEEKYNYYKNKVKKLLEEKNL